MNYVLVLSKFGFNGFLSCYQLHKNYSETVYITFFVHFIRVRIFYPIKKDKKNDINSFVNACGRNKA
ncbi:hypothetical protein AQUCO_00800147v1 [Aquilegia coerulea]|uniref:Uncharacterized protein n=1 Tax=Aquilegia coerulea TaxID=218851 RepID=A0A2G5EHF1_AQUCA|nr:hypothetical protein AQUCO_00800147v1 [Aquilegia coerulea]